MDPDKRGNPPFEPSSYAAGLERRLARAEQWNWRMRNAAQMLLEGTEDEKQFAAAWWRDLFNEPTVVLSDSILTQTHDKTTEGD